MFEPKKAATFFISILAIVMVVIVGVFVARQVGQQVSPSVVKQPVVTEQEPQKTESTTPSVTETTPIPVQAEVVAKGSAGPDEMKAILLKKMSEADYESLVSRVKANQTTSDDDKLIREAIDEAVNNTLQK